MSTAQCFDVDHEKTIGSAARTETIKECTSRSLLRYGVKQLGHCIWVSVSTVPHEFTPYRVIAWFFPLGSSSEGEIVSMESASTARACHGSQQKILLSTRFVCMHMLVCIWSSGRVNFYEQAGIISLVYVCMKHMSEFASAIGACTCC